MIWVHENAGSIPVIPIAYLKVEKRLLEPWKRFLKKWKRSERATSRIPWVKDGGDL